MGSASISVIEMNTVRDRSEHGGQAGGGWGDTTRNCAACTLRVARAQRASPNVTLSPYDSSVPLSVKPIHQVLSAAHGEANL